MRAAHTEPLRHWATLIVVADVDGNGPADVVVALKSGTPGSDGTVTVLRMAPDGSVRERFDVATGAGEARSLTAADFDGDGITDVGFIADQPSFTGRRLGLLRSSCEGELRD